MEVSPPQDGTIVILSGAGLSAPSGVATFRGAGGLWEGHRVEDVATPEAWWRDREMVRRFYMARRQAMRPISPNPGHHALIRLQQAWGMERVWLVTQNVDGLLHVAARDQGLAADAFRVIEMHGSLRRLKCEADDFHPHVDAHGDERDEGTCAVCGGYLRPDIVWFGEIPEHMSDISVGMSRCTLFVSVGTSGLVYPAAGFVDLARSRGAHCVEVNPAPSGGRFHQVVAEGAEVALPRLVDSWLKP